MGNKKENNVADQPLVEMVLRGNTNAFKTIMNNTEGLVAQIVFKMIPVAEDRKDIAQDIYLKTFQKLNTFKFRSKLSTWIAQIAYNTCLSYLEKKKLIFPGNNNDDNQGGEDVLEILNNKIAPVTNETENIIFQKELSEILKTEINKLSPVYKTLMTLYHNEELSYAEIAEITSLPEGTLKSYLFRARKTLKNNLLLTYKKGSFMKYLHLTDDEIQQYVLEKANCADEVIEHIGSCLNCKEKAAQYRLLFEGIKQQEKPVFDFNLADLVLDQLPKTQTKPSSEKWFSFLIIFISTLFVGAIGYLFGKNLVSIFAGISSALIGLIIITVAALFIFLFVDMNRKYQAKMKALNFY